MINQGISGKEEGSLNEGGKAVRQEACCAPGCCAAKKESGGGEAKVEPCCAPSSRPCC